MKIMKSSNKEKIKENDNKIIFITGTPGTGKTTLANLLESKFSKNYNFQIVKINDLAIENNLIDGVDSDKGYNIVNVQKLDKKLNEVLDSFFNEKDLNDSKLKISIVEGHLSHLCNCENVDKIIVLRLNPKILESRLKSRNYSEYKIHENLEAEALGVCSVEAYQKYGTKVNEIDTSDLSIKEVFKFVEDIIFNKKDFPVGSIDFMRWILGGY
nr:adenylate kinase family protein [Methanobrevibacter arboriphilus]